MKTLQRTLTIVKPDAVRKNAIGDIIEQFEKGGFRILELFDDVADRILADGVGFNDGQGAFDRIACSFQRVRWSIVVRRRDVASSPCLRRLYLRGEKRRQLRLYTFTRLHPLPLLLRLGQLRPAISSTGFKRLDLFRGCSMAPASPSRRPGGAVSATMNPTTTSSCAFLRTRRPVLPHCRRFRRS